MLDWLIVGGGIHGTALSYRLLRHLNFAHEKLRVLDAEAEPLARWRANTGNVGMRYLRSPGVHHLHSDPFSLRTFAATRAGQPHTGSIPLYERPALALFNAHSEWLLDKFRLREVRLHGRAQALTRIAGGWRVESEQGAVDTRRVVLALGVSDAPHVPAWAQPLKDAGAPVFHIFDRDFTQAALAPYARIAIVGGGISAAQAALALAHAGKQVMLWMRHAVRLSHFDSDPCWVTAICLADFHRERDYPRRRALIRQARQRGSLPPDVADALREAIAQRQIRLVRGEIAGLEAQPDASLELSSADGDTQRANALLLATGFSTARPGGAWLDAAIDAHGLPTAPDGYPMPDPCLRWSDGLYVTGALAELELGPTARNIIGARLAGERLVRGEVVHRQGA